MSHGVDLKDDLARFQIIVKAPYLPTKDKRIEKLMKDDFNWYSNKMLCSLIQSCGRGVTIKKRSLYYLYFRWRYCRKRSK